MEKLLCRSPEVYPEVLPCSRNEHDLRLICPLYAGNVSELTAILQYIYQDQVLTAQCKEVSEALKSIAIVEMHHLELLSCAICAMGGNPRYVNPNIRGMWNAGAVAYEQDLCKALLLDLRHETEARRAYLAAAGAVKHPSLAALLRRIAVDEKIHMDIFTNLINCHCRKKEAPRRG